MYKLNTFALFGLLFLSSMLLVNGLYSNNVSVLAQHENVDNLNEAEVNTEIEQENKCKKDTECENENEINNLLNITTITQTQQQEQQETPTCEECFTDNLSESAIIFIEDTFFQNPASIQDVCQWLDENIQNQEQLQTFVNYLFDAVLNNSNTNAQDLYNLLNCLEEVFGVTFPEPNIIT